MASGVNLSNAQLFAHIQQISGCALSATQCRRVPAPPTISIRRVQAEFGWQPTAVFEKLSQLVVEHEPA